jgi:cyclic beta-1,2-glucan synthetase
MTLEYPLLSDLFSNDQLDKQGEAMARLHELDRRPALEKLLMRLTINEKILTETHTLLSAGESTGHSLLAAGVWLLDNFFLIKEQIQLVRQHLPKRYSRELPRLRAGQSAGLPRVYEIVRDLISHVDGRVDEGNLRTTIVSYQRVTSLSLGELWAIPIMLRLALIENLGRIAARIAASRRDRDIAEAWAARMLKTSENDPKNIILDIADMARAGISMSCAFIAELVRMLQSHNPALALVLTWIEQRLTEQGQTIERQVHLDSQQQATNHIAMGNSIASLRFLSSFDWKNFVEAMSRVESILRNDPAGVYQKMDFTTRDTYRHAVEKIAKQAHTSEENVAAHSIALARSAANQARDAHIGTYLVDRQRPVLEQAVGMHLTIRNVLTRILKRTPLLFYLGFLLLISSGLSFVVLREIHSASTGTLWVMSILMLIGFSQAAVGVVNWAVTMTIRPRLLPKMDFAAGIPPESCTLITVPAMLSSVDAIAGLLNKMEVCYLSNQADNLYFSLLTDFEDATTETTPGDMALLELAKQGMERLNDTYARNGHRSFLLFHRPRTWNPREKRWMGYERKRGKLEALNRFLRSPETTDFLIEGDFAIVHNVKYVLTLDTDTELPRDCARHLIEAMAHPLNAPVYDACKGRIVDGYAILQPRMVSSLPGVDASWYARIFSSDSGIDPYTRAVSDVYQDLYREGSFIGKGIYDVDMFAKVLANRLPENRVLSHDLLEGTYCRSGLVSDVQMVDEFPERYSADHSRRYRWIRGDWQIAAWLAPYVPGFNPKPVRNPLSLLSQWKIFDNLRRSLIPAALLLLIVVSWLLVTPSWLGVAAVVAILLLPTLPGVMLKAARIPHGFPLYAHLQSVVGFMGLQLFEAFFTLAVLPFEAFSYLDAILRTCWRLLISRRKLLEWTVSGKAAKASGQGVWGYFRLMGAAVLFALLLGALLLTQGRLDVWPLLGIWFFSPLLPWWISRPLVPRPTRLSVKQFDFLKKIARKTWRYFETFAGFEDNWLPADNYQEGPREVVAHRTSPTNIGLMLLANLGAYDLGYLCTGHLIDKTRKSFKSMDALTRFRGHFFNWYDTKTLQPLAPSYVSTVDSGNLAGYLLTLRVGLLELRDRPIFHQQVFEGLSATLSVLEELIVVSPPGRNIAAVHCIALARTLREFQQTPAGLNATLVRIRNIIAEIHELRTLTGEKFTADARWWFDAFEHQCIGWQEELRYLAPWLAAEVFVTIDSNLQHDLDVNRTLAQITQIGENLPALQACIDRAPDIADEHTGKTRIQYVALQELIILGSRRAQERIRSIEELALQCQQLSEQDYDFLYDTSRHLLSIGYDVAKHRKDDAFYDLLASESRLGSFIAIAQGKLPVEHWFRLGRLVTIRRGKTLLLSWGGSMFEYLMPRLVMPGYDHTLLGQTCEAIVDCQIEYGRKRGVPWGISESAENRTDASLNYQYRSFGVPELGFKRDLANDLVIAPYATVLALMIKPQAACENMERLTADGYEGRYGFYEAIDFTPSRLSGEHSPALIRSFMAHHQGMSFVSIVNFIAGNPMKNRFESDPLFQTTTLLLQERVPKVSPFHLQTSELLAARKIIPGQLDQPRFFTTPHTTIPEVHLLSNGHYHVMITNAGSGYSRWRDLAVTRWSEDPTMDSCGTFVYINDLSTVRRWSAAYQPTCAEPKNYEAIFPLARAEFRRRDGGLDTYTEIAVSPEDDIEQRRITLSNFTGKSRIIELTSYAEVVLVTPAADASHPAFSNLFMQTEILHNRHAILCSRRPRSPEEACPWMFHLFTVRGLENYELSYQTDRLAFIGRGRTTRNPRAMETEGPLNGADGSVLDPIVAIRCRLTLKAGEVLTIGFISGMAETRQHAEALIDKYQDQQLADRVFDLAGIHGNVVLRQLDITEAEAQLYGELASSILYASQYRRAHPPVLLKNTRGQSNLWAYSISGDVPIVLLHIGDPSKIQLAAKLLQAHAYWQLKGLIVDLVILNEERTGYRQVFNDQLAGLIAAGHQASLVNKTGGVFLRHSDQISDEDQILLQAVARAIFLDSGGTLTEQIRRYFSHATPIPKLVASRFERDVPAPQNFRQDNLLFFNGWGGFTQDGRE